MRHRSTCLMLAILVIISGCRTVSPDPGAPVLPEPVGPLGQVTEMSVHHPASQLRRLVEPGERVVTGPGEIIVAIAFEPDVHMGLVAERLRANGVRPGSALWVNAQLQFSLHADDPGPFQIRLPDVTYGDTPVLAVGFDLERGLFHGAVVRVGQTEVDALAGLTDLPSVPLDIEVSWGAPVDRISVEQAIRQGLGGDAALLWDSDQVLRVRIGPTPGQEVVLDWTGAKDQRGRPLWSPGYRFAFE